MAHSDRNTILFDRIKAVISLMAKGHRKGEEEDKEEDEEDN